MNTLNKDAVESLITYLRTKYQLLIGSNQAQDLLTQAKNVEAEMVLFIHGRNQKTGEEQTIKLRANKIIKIS